MLVIPHVTHSVHCITLCAERLHVVESDLGSHGS